MRKSSQSDERKMSQASMSNSSLNSFYSSSWGSPSTSMMSSGFGTSPSASSLVSTTPSSVGTGNMDDRHILFCGSSGSGKTSLIFTLGRGFFPPQEILPRRFEGWSISATATPAQSGLYSEYNKKYKPYSVNLTFWEDRPRLKQPSESSENAENEKETEKEEEEKACEEEEAKREFDPNGLRVHYHPSNNKNDVNFSAEDSSSRDRKNSQDSSSDEEDLSIGFPRPQIPLLSPEPDVLVLCYACDNPESFKAAEGWISAELKERFPGVPIILVATKSDLARDQQDQTCSKSDEVGNEDVGLGESPNDVTITENDSMKNDDDEEDDDIIWTMEHDDNNSITLSEASTNIISSEQGLYLTNKIEARVFLECSAKEQQGLSRIIEETVWALMVKNANPMMAALMASAGSMGGNLSSSPSVNSGLTLGSSRKTSETSGSPSVNSGLAPSRKISDTESSYFSLASLLKTASPLSTSWPKSAMSGTSPTSGSGEKKGRKISNISNGNQKSCPNFITLASPPVITIAHPYLISSPNSQVPAPPGRTRKTSYGATLRKFMQNYNPISKD